jgi:broad specificity phosphatase PhoE
MTHLKTGRVYIVRHGNTFDKGETLLRVGGKTDLPLSVSGRVQAKALAAHFAGVSFQQAYSSDLNRTRQTAEAILGGQSFDLAHFLTEIDYGPDEGQPEHMVISRLGQAALDEWDQRAVPPADWHVDPEELRTAWQAFLANCSPSANTLVVTSNGVARFLLDVVEVNQDVPRKLRTGAYGTIDLTPKGPVLNSWDVRP